MELGSILGLIIGLLVFFVSMLLAVDGDFGMMITAYIDGVSAIIVFGGTFFSAFLAFPLDKVLGAVKSVGIIFKPLNANPRGSITEIIELANLARREGILALEERASTMEDPFLKKGIMLIVDGTDPELVRSILETEMTYIETRHSNVRIVWDYFGSQAPAWGMVGTFVGLIAMLLNLDDPDNLGPAMAVALITSLYGAFIANLLAIPISRKLKFFNNEELIMKEISLEGMLSIQAGENPRIIEEKLKSFLSPKMREAAADSGAEAGE
ncbi:MAG: motility protein A [Defluviitaleaceae bacterium]|nr:motility protein A [Defluviitaleaceae bacterium]